MNRSRQQFVSWLAACCGIAALVFCGAALADPPGRAARLAQISGAVSFSPAGEDDWVLAPINRPLITGDRVWADNGAHAELQIGAASARLGSMTSVALLNLDDHIAQIDLAQGTLNLHVRRIYPDQVYEIDTPNLAFSVRRAGDFRVDVDPAGNATIIRVRSGEGEAWGEGAAYTVAAGQQASFAGQGLQDYSFDTLSAPDEFDNWTYERNRREDAAIAARYVSPDTIGYADLDDYGSWRPVEGYGTVWFPNAVAADWAPYRTGHWAWVDPWGWTWVDDAPWGFAPFHYGRWAFVSSHWCWVPGPIAVRPVYAPALVAFVGGNGFSLALTTGAVAGIAWWALGPGEVYRPPFAVSRNFFTNINVSNTVVNTTVVNNFYNNVNVTNVTYRNRELPGAVTAIPVTAFGSAEPVARHAVAVSPAAVAHAPVTPVAAVTPSRASVLGVGAVAAGAAAAVAVARRPPPAVLARPVVARSAPPPPAPSFAAKSSLLAAQPGQPLAAEKLKSLAPARTTDAAKVKVVTPSVTPQPLTKGAARERAAPTGQPAGAAAVPRPPQERTLQQSKGTPPGTNVPQPPPAAQERMLKDSKAAPSAGTTAQPANAGAYRERKGPPSGGGESQPSNERRQESKGTPPSATVPQPPRESAVVKAPPPQPAAKPAPPPQPATKPAPQPERAQKAPPPQPETKSKAEENKAKENKAKEQGHKED
jgi:hypothetical protein